MRRTITCILLFGMIIFTGAGSAEEIKFSYVNEDIGVGAVFSDNWKLYTDESNSIAFFKQYFSEKKGPNDSPLFLGNISSMQAFTRCLVEKTDLSLVEYFKLLNNVLLAEKCVIREVKYFKDLESISVIFEVSKNSFNLKFKEVLSIKNGYAVRLSFWTVEAAFNDNLAEFDKAIKNFYFRRSTDGGAPAWTRRWHSIDTAESSTLDFVKVESGKDSIHKFGREDRAVFYEIKGEKNSVYLLGSIHLGHPDFYPMPERIENAFAKSPNVVYEIDMTSRENREKLRSYQGSKMIKLEGDKTLESVLSKELYEKLTAKFKELGVDIHKYRQYRPWFIASMLTSLQAISMGYSSDYGVDMYFMKRSSGKKVHELETVDDQIMMLAEDMDEQAYLAYTLISYDISKIKLKDLILSWKRGDVNTLESIIFSRDYNILNLSGELYEKLFYKRNERMAEKILGYLKLEGDYFVVVGAGHLIGDRSIIDILKKKGYAVTASDKGASKN